MNTKQERNPLSRRSLLGAREPSPESAAASSHYLDLMRRRGLKMRSANRQILAQPGVEGGAPTSAPLGVIVYNRMAFGPRPGDKQAFEALAGTDTARLEAFVEQQLDPDSIVDTEAENRIASANFESIGINSDPDQYVATLWNWYVHGNAPSGNTSSWLPVDELKRWTLIRAMFSKKQLVEVLADFWHNHFSVYRSTSSWVRVPLPQLDLLLRTWMMGNFRGMLEVVARSTSMLRYLDNYTNSAAGPNENFSRELFELHTLGSENYWGVIPQSQVPTDSQGRPVGYVDDDVFESTRCLTGWSISYGVDGDGHTGRFNYRQEWHDRFQKHVLGSFIPPDQPDLKDARDVFDLLASHPGTGRHIARKLCQKFISDNPPQSIVDAAADVFTMNWAAPDQLKQVYRTILLSDEFRTTWAQKIKRPFHIAVSAMRACNANFTPRMDSPETNSFFWRYEGTGHAQFSWPAPNGYPDVRGAWQSMTPRVMSWRLCGWLVDFKDPNDNFYLNVLAQTPSHIRSANALADFWINRILNRPMDPADRDQIVQFMAQGFNPDFDLNFNDTDTQDRLRSMVALLLMSPDFLWR